MKKKGKCVKKTQKKQKQTQPGRFAVSARKRLAACLALVLFWVSSGPGGSPRRSSGSKAQRGKPQERRLHRAARRLPSLRVRGQLEMNQGPEGIPEGTLRELIVDLPPGLVGNPRAVPRCPARTSRASPQLPR